MKHVVSMIQNFVSGIVFGNGWLALAGITVVCLATLVVRRSRGIRV
jgi:ABC-type uncharacterized transport system permease subunit